ncbi:hypothetical protein [Pantoea allii]|uniref:hypothetical protein n=1 Tax=Pantoea allii TaxID=574096 RepID=UPI003D7A81FC
MERKNSPSLTAKAIYERLKEAGYPKSYILRLLPEGWDNSFIKTIDGIAQFTSILNQKIGINIVFSSDNKIIVEENNELFRFKYLRNTNPCELTISANIGRALFKHAISCIKKDYAQLDSDPMRLRKEILKRSNDEIMTFELLLDFCWNSGIPVIFLDDLPRTAKRMTGMALCVNGRPGIVLGFKNKQTSRQLFVLAHEVGHIACGHVSLNGILVDESLNDVKETISDVSLIKKDQQEKEADSFALKLIRGGIVNPLLEFNSKINSTELAANAIIKSQELKIDPGHLIISYAKLYDDWTKAGLAMNFLHNQDKAINLLEEKFFLYSDLSMISNENRDFLISAQGYIAIK